MKCSGPRVKELPQVNRTYDPVEDQKVNFLVFKFIKNPFGPHKNLLNSKLVSKLISTAAEWIVLSFDTPYYTELPSYSPKTEMENWVNMCPKRGWFFFFFEKYEITCKSCKARSVSQKYLRLNHRILFPNNYRLCSVMENTEIWLADTRNKVTFMFA